MRPNAERSRRAIIFLWIFTAISLLSIFAHLNQFILVSNIEKGTYIYSDIQTNLIIQSVFAIALLVIYLLTGIFFIQWFRRAYFNLHSISKDMSYSEGWAAGAWFVPFMNWVRPYKIMKEMMIFSENALIKQNLIQENRNREKLVVKWWALWIITSIISYINGQVQSKSDNLDVLKICSQIDIAISFAYLPLTIITVRMIKEYAEMEKHLPNLEPSNRPFRMDDSDLLDTI